MKLLQDIIHSLTPFYEPSEAKSLAIWLIEEYFSMPYPLFLQNNAILTTSQQTDIQRIITRLQIYEPIQYIFGKTYWRGLELIVNPSVLIPRPETSELVDWVLNDFQTSKLTLLDCCTGSGCIAIALKKARPNWQISAIDINEKALQVAQQNTDNQFVNISLLQADALHLPSQKYDVIVCNPPYIMEQEKADMAQNVLQYEPANALFVPDNDPLLFYRAIAQQHLSPILFFEIDHLQGQSVCHLLQSLGYTTELRQDMQGKDRFVKAIIQYYES